MSKNVLQPQGDFPSAGFWKRMAAIFYDFMLCIALVMVVTLIYQQGILRMIYGADALQEMADSGMLDIDPVLSTLVFFSIFAFFAKFWTHGGQTLGMQVWGLRVQNADGSAIDIWQALLRFLIAIFAWLPAGLGFLWILFDTQKRSWSDMYSGSVVVQLPKNVHKK
ncbi:RDD family protein [Denitrificimonas caeni]|uniref:RDD family protein n=1 Tax=Denitrificimonas caeni TaxID=521720 RepID=A0AAE9VMZ1_9GAMM|nr:RDD family protein [Denitrificimonas caeni]WBE24742.1 RDD family protein [Denitrificimonas caeni]